MRNCRAWDVFSRLYDWKEMLWYDCGSDRDVMTFGGPCIECQQYRPKNHDLLRFLRDCVERCICVSAEAFPRPTVHAVLSSRNKLTLEPIDLDLIHCVRKDHFLRVETPVVSWLPSVKVTPSYISVEAKPILPSRVDSILRILYSQTLLMWRNNSLVTALKARTA